MDFNSYILNCGLRTRIEQLKITINGQQNQTIGGELQTDIGVIYGLSSYTDGVAFDGSTLITTAQAETLFLNIKKGKIFTVQNLKLSDLQNEFAGSPLIRTDKYTPMIIYREDFDLSSSQIINPTLIPNGSAVIILNFWYIDVEDLQMLEAHGLIFNDKHPKSTSIYPYHKEAIKKHK